MAQRRNGIKDEVEVEVKVKEKSAGRRGRSYAVNRLPNSVFYRRFIADTFDFFSGLEVEFYPFKIPFEGAFKCNFLLIKISRGIHQHIRVGDSPPTLSASRISLFRMSYFSLLILTAFLPSG